MSMLDDLKTSFFRFREKKYAIWVGLLLTFAVCSLLLIYAGYLLCFGLLLVAIVGYYIPYFFGLKSKKKLAVWGIVLIVLLAFPFTATIIAQQQNYANTTLSTSDNAMVDGKVAPFDGDPSTSHHFSILVKDPSYTDVRVIVYDAWSTQTVVNQTMTATNTSAGQLYAYDTQLQNRSEYVYQFAAFNNSQYVTTGQSYGPITVTTTDLYAHWLPLVFTALLVEVGVLFYLLLALNWMTERSRKKAAQMNKDLQEKDKRKVTEKGKEEKFVCSECGAEVPSSAEKCPQCGERFDDDKKGQQPKSAEKGKDEFVCTECGAKVDENAKSCWNCGKEFEN